MPPTQEALPLEIASIAHSNLAWMQLALNRTNEARANLQNALAHKLEDHQLRMALYEIGFLDHDQAMMQQQLAWAAGRPRQEDWLLSAQADTEAYAGHLATAREFSQRAVESARRADANETAALWHANAALREAEFGNPGPARRQAQAALALTLGKDVRSVAALALARAGDAVQAQKLADSLNKGFSPGHRRAGLLAAGDSRRHRT